MSTNTRQNASQFCRLFAKQDCSTPIDFNFNESSHLALPGVGSSLVIASQANVVGSGVALSTSLPGALRVFSDDGGASVGDSVRGVQSRTLLTHDQAGGTIRALQGQLKLADLVDVTTGIYTGVQGYVEMAGTHVAKTGSTFSCIDASAEIGTSLTIDSGGEFYGVHVETTGSGTITNTGKNCAAIGITKASGAAAWPCGVYIPVGGVYTGIRVGDWVGSGASGSAIAFATTADIYADGQLSVVAAFGESTSNLTAAYNAHVGRFRHIATGSALTVAQETYGLIGQMCAKGATMTHLHAGLMGTFEGTGAAVVCNSSYTLGGHAAVMARVGGHTNITATTPLAGFMAFNNGTAALTSGSLYAYGVSVRDTSYKWTYGMYVPGSTVSNGIQLGTTSVPITLAANTNRALDIATTCPNTSTEADAVKINAVYTGVAGIDVALRVNMETNVKLGDWANAAYISLDLKTNGGAAGLGSVLCSELVMGAAATEGTFGVFEGEISCPASWTGTGPVSFLYLNVYGDTKTNFDDYGYLMTLTGVSSGSTDLFYDHTDGSFDGWLKIKVNADTYYIPLMDGQAA